MGNRTDLIHGLAGRSPVADELARIGAEALIFFVLVVIAVILLRQSAYQTLLVAAAAAVLAVGIAGLIGVVSYVPRPFVSEHFVPLIRCAPGYRPRCRFRARIHGGNRALVCRGGVVARAQANGKGRSEPRVADPLGWMSSVK